MRLEECYRSLGLKPGASREQVKTAYRTLARKFHPDTGTEAQRSAKNAKNSNPHETFLRITTAYKHLIQTFPIDDRRSVVDHRPIQSDPYEKARSNHPEDLLKHQAYQRLRQLFAEQKFAPAIALVEALDNRLPDDPEVNQWRAIAYQQQGRHLIRSRQYPQALRYLQKALATNPNNRSLVATLHQDLKSLHRQIKQSAVYSGDLR
jgi:tetratricopeptide (TPR) repeat protein